MSIISQINDYLLADQEKRKEKKRNKEGSGKIRPSGLGQCYRRQWYAIKQEEETNPPDLPSIKRMLLGTVVHETMQKAFENTEVKIEDDAVKGFADVVGEDFVCDIKTVNPYAFKWMKWDNFNIHAEKADHCLQVALYGVKLKKPNCKLLYVSTGDFNKMEEFTFPTSMYEDKVNAELQVIGNYINDNDFPPPEPRLYGQDKDGNPKECSYCSYRDRCAKDTPTI